MTAAVALYRRGWSAFCPPDFAPLLWTDLTRYIFFWLQDLSCPHQAASFFCLNISDYMKFWKDLVRARKKVSSDRSNPGGGGGVNHVLPQSSGRPTCFPGSIKYRSGWSVGDSGSFLEIYRYNFSIYYIFVRNEIWGFLKFPRIVFELQMGFRIKIFGWLR